MISAIHRDRLLARLLGRAPLIGGPLRRRALRGLLALGQPWAVREVADAVCHDPGSWEALRPGLLALREPSCRGAVCAAWERTRDEGLLAPLRRAGHVPEGPPPVRVRACLKLGRADALTGVGPDGAGALLEACADADPAIVAGARQALRQLRNPRAQDALCQRVID